MHRQSTIQIDIQTPPQLAPPGCRGGKVLAGASNLANLLPTGTVLIPSFTDGGSCLITHKYLTLGPFLILLLHGQFHRSEGKNTLWNRVSERLLTMSKDALKEYLRSYSLKRMDFIRALVSLIDGLLDVCNR